MDIFGSASEYEKYLRQKCADKRQPFSGAIELTPSCNMDCRFCYVHQNKNQRKEQGQLLTGDQWCDILDQAFDMGVYSMLVTGGEPLLHPEFRRIISYAASKGFVVILNSNGTLMTEEDIEFLVEIGCRRVNISLYGADNETYESLCGYPGGFDRVMRTLHLLKEYRMPVHISVSLTPQNIGQIDAIHQITKELGFEVKYASYMFPGTRRGIGKDDQYRLTPKDAAAATIKCFHLTHPQADYEASCRFSLAKIEYPSPGDGKMTDFACYAAKTDFWLAWNGEMRPCGIFQEPALTFRALEDSLKDCWESMTQKALETVCKSEACVNCNRRDLCHTCPAACFAETGRMDGRPDYLCEMTNEIVHICEQAIS